MKFGYLIFGLISIGYSQTYEEFIQTRKALGVECEKVPMETELGEWYKGLVQQQTKSLRAESSKFIPSDGYLEAKALVERICQVEIEESMDNFIMTKGYFQNCYVLHLATALTTDLQYVRDEACKIYKRFGQLDPITGWIRVGRLLFWYKNRLRYQALPASVNTHQTTLTKMQHLLEMLDPLNALVNKFGQRY